jgi:hypothetical protein
MDLVGPLRIERQERRSLDYRETTTEICESKDLNDMAFFQTLACLATSLEFAIAKQRKQKSVDRS